MELPFFVMVDVGDQTEVPLLSYRQFALNWRCFGSSSLCPVLKTVQFSSLLDWSHLDYPADLEDELI